MKRLAARLTKLEQGTVGVDPSPEADRMLVELLAKRDALFWPWRHDSGFGGALASRRRQYLAGQRGFPARAGDGLGWKSAHMVRNELIARGLAVAMGSGSEVTALRLTDQGEADARALVGDRLATFGKLEVHALWWLINWQRHDFHDWGGLPYMAEGQIVCQDLHGEPHEWHYITELFLPLLTAGLLLANHDCTGRVYYAIHYARIGVAVGEDLPLLPPFTVSKREPAEWADAVYLKAFAGEQAALMKLSSAEISLPLPASQWWRSEDRQQTSVGVAVNG
jgi:hypothetical protein